MRTIGLAGRWARPIAVLTANSASKAILRAGLDEFLRSRADQPRAYYYFPGYEIVTDVFRDPYESDNMHVVGTVVAHVLSLSSGTTPVSGSRR